MIPPKGFKAELYPLRHRLIFSCGLGIGAETANTVYLPIVMSSEDMDVEPETIRVNPHNSAYVEDTGPLVRQMSIIDRLKISLRFNMTENCDALAETAAASFNGDGIKALHFLWRPIFGSFTDKLDAADDDTTNTVAAILGLTHDATQQDVVPITTTKLPVPGASDLSLPISTVNAVQVVADYNMTTDFTMEEHVFDEDLLHNALRRFTNKGALRSLLGRTRHVTLTQNRPFKNFFIDKFLPRSIRRIMPFSFLGIQVHMPFITDVEQAYHSRTITGTPHLGVKCLAMYHEWSNEHDQDMESQV